MAKVSIIMPAYNAEKYVDKAIMSVIGQIYDDWELVIVDDCSTDRTAETCESYSAKDGRIKLFKNISNQGISRTKNIALSKATGKYIAFCDDDDIMNEKALSDNIKLMEEHDSQVVRWSYRTVRLNEKGDLVRVTNVDCKDGVYSSRKEIFDNYENVHTMLSCDWTGLYDASFLNKHSICFDESFRFGGEDTNFNADTLKYVENMTMNSKCYYDWYLRKNHSTTEKRNINFCMSMMQVAQKEYELIRDNCLNNRDIWTGYRAFYTNLIRKYAQSMTESEINDVEDMLTGAEWANCYTSN